MPEQDTRDMEHEIIVSAPAQTVYQLIAEVENWPTIFPPTVYVDYLERTKTTERIRIWATANGEAKSWTSRRSLDPTALRIDFHQEVSAKPVAAMHGAWIIEPLTEGSSRVRLLHSYSAIDDDPESLAWIEQAVDRNSITELAAMKDNLERVQASAELAMDFSDTVEIAGSAKDAYDFINEAGLWKERLPHVSAIRLEEPSPGVQTLEMDTHAKDGSTHTTKSFRVCFPHRKIAYKQVTLPALMSLHTGYWTFEDTDQGVAARSQHTVVINPANIAKILGAQATVLDAKRYVQDALSTNSRATLGYAKDYAEHRR